MERDLIKTHQQRLRDLGWYSGVIDGIDGTLTAQAFSRFKTASGFRNRPYPGPKTLGKLWSRSAKKAPKVSKSSKTPLLDIIKQYDGLKEISGPKTSPQIRTWLKELGMPWTDDETAWCGITVGGVVLEFYRGLGVDFKFSFNPAGAQQWRQFGVRCDPVPGSIGPMWRGSSKSWKGHVIIVDYVIKDKKGRITHIVGYGGNQSNAVNRRKFPIRRFRFNGKTDFRIPQELKGKTPPVQVGKATVKSTDGNEA